MRRLVNLVAAGSMSLAVPAALTSRLQVPASTVKRYLNLLDLLFITRIRAQQIFGPRSPGFGSLGASALTGPSCTCATAPIWQRRPGATARRRWKAECPVTVLAGKLHPMGLLRRRAGRGSVNIHKASVKVPSFSPYTGRVMAMVSAWTFSTLQGAGEAVAKPEKPNRDSLTSLHREAVLSWEAGRKKPTTIIRAGWRFREGACEHALRP